MIDAYRQEVAEKEGEEHKAARQHRQEEIAGEASDLRWGSREAEISSIRLLVGGEERYHVESGEPVVFEIRAWAAQALDDFVFGVAVATPRGTEVWGTNTDLEGYVAGTFAGEATVRLACPPCVSGGRLRRDVAVHSKEGAPYDYQRRALAFTVTARDSGIGMYLPEHGWEFAGGVKWAGRKGEGERS